MKTCVLEDNYMRKRSSRDRTSIIFKTVACESMFFEGGDMKTFDLEDSCMRKIAFRERESIIWETAVCESMTFEDRDTSTPLILQTGTCDGRLFEKANPTY